MRPGDLFGDLGQRGIARSGILEAILCHCHDMSAATPLADQARAWF
jgi:hypothetical protein